jgi:hypothetical protein
MNLRTNFKVKVKKIVNGKTVTRKMFTIRFSDMRKRFLLTSPKKYLEKIKFDNGLLCDLTVYYCSSRFFNNGRYNNHKDLLHAFECFTEQELLKGEWDKVLIPQRVLTSDQRMALKLMRMKNRSNVPPKKKTT